MAHAMVASRTLALRVEQAHPTRIFTGAGSSENTALSIQAARDDERSDDFTETQAALCCSPMFALAAVEFVEDQRRDLDAGMMSSLARRRALLRFATRLYRAGMLGAL